MFLKKLPLRNFGEFINWRGTTGIMFCYQTDGTTCITWGLISRGDLLTEFYGSPINHQNRHLYSFSTFDIGHVAKI